MPSILIIDDKQANLTELSDELQANVGKSAKVVPWRPGGTQQDKPFDHFAKTVESEDVRLVVTDYDLTEGGQLGLFGATVVDWCQSRAIPVGDFTRGPMHLLPEQPNLFELRVPTVAPKECAAYIGALFRGFEAVRNAIVTTPALLNRRSPTSVLAAILNAQNQTSQLAQYGMSHGGANSALIDLFAPGKKKKDKASLVAYIAGHLLVNSILKYPGPLVDSNGLAAYLAVDIGNHSSYVDFFGKARYTGPFDEMGPYFWTEKVEESLAPYLDSLPIADRGESPGEQNRNALQKALGKQLSLATKCKRCGGKNGGFLCPFTKQTVCQLDTCSVRSNVWVPPGAHLSRIEREFFDEWSPILGM
jgi:hypothetical protein